jgi:hypothetical protein
VIPEDARDGGVRPRERYADQPNRLTAEARAVGTPIRSTFSEDSDSPPASPYAAGFAGSAEICWSALLGRIIQRGFKADLGRLTALLDERNDDSEASADA